MSTLGAWGLKECMSDEDATSPSNSKSDIFVQLSISAALGVASFLAFCVSSLSQSNPVGCC